MLSSLFWTLLGCTGLGGGLWLAAMFVPSVAAVLRLVVDFLRSPFGMICAAVVAGLLLYSSGWIAGDLHGTRATRAEWRADNAAKADAARREIADNKQAAADDADKRIAAIAAYADSLEKKVSDDEAQNSGRPACRLTDDDVRRLRHLGQ